MNGVAEAPSSAQVEPTPLLLERIRTALWIVLGINITVAAGQLFYRDAEIPPALLQAAVPVAFYLVVLLLVKRQESRFVAISNGLLTLTAVIVSMSLTSQSFAQPARVPTFEVDPAWPAVPADWMLGEVTSIAAARDGHIWVLHRPRSIPEAERERAVAAGAASL